MIRRARVLVPDDELRDAVSRAASTLMRPGTSEPLRQHRLVAHRARHDWDAECAAAARHLGASTPRRRLDAETSGEQASPDGIAGIVRKVGLTTALALLQTAHLPVGEVAMRCRWTSQVRFTAAFQSRWGSAPALLRKPNR